MAAAAQHPIVVIVGETASGKSALAMQLAERFDGEIICADSRTVYKGMNVGTAKPGAEERTRVKHHLLDVVTPEQDFTAAQFKSAAQKAIISIVKKGKLPIMVGGTGLYIDGLLYDFGFEKKLDKKTLRPNTLLIGLVVDRQVIKERITNRVEAMIENGLEAEVRRLVKKYGWHAKAMTAIGYREFQPYFAGLQTQEDTKKQIERDTILYAKRQRTWFKRNESIHWLDDPREVVDLVTTFLNKKR